MVFLSSLAQDFIEDAHDLLPTPDSRRFLSSLAQDFIEDNPNGETGSYSD